MPSRFGHDPEADWERFGCEEPYYGVYFHPRFRRANLTPERLDEFFESGEEHVDALWTTITHRLVPGFAPHRVLEFGCGVGRVLVPLARRAEAVVGVDVSAAMIDEARRNVAARGIENVTVVRCDESLALAGGDFDLVHSFVVLQHVPPRKGERLIAALIDALAEGGVGALHVTFANDLRRRTRLLRWARRSLPFVHSMLNWKDGKPVDAPWMQMNHYDLNRVFRLLEERGCHDCVVRFTKHFGHRGVMLFFRKVSEPSFP
jgi:SAM-dependent methyltransferase